MPRSSGFRLLFAVAIAVVAAPHPASAQPTQPPAVAAPEAQVPADEALKRGEAAYEKQDYAEAMRWYRVAADQGNPQAQVQIGNLYTDGQGVAQDYGEAMGWFQKAAVQGNYEAQNNIGWFYLSAWGVTQDYGEAMRWFRLAADQGNEIAQRNIAMMYVQGLGVPADKDEAIRWFKKAAAAGDDESKDALKQLGAE